MDNVKNILKDKLSAENMEKLAAIKNSKLHDFVAWAVELANPDSVFVCTDSDADRDYIRKRTIELGEEIPLATKGHTCHFDNYNDQARDKANTKYLLRADADETKSLNWVEREAGKKEVHSYLKDSMVGRQMIVAFFCLGPIDSQFSIPCVQITDSSYVCHSETILYRPGYEQFQKIGDSPEFFRFIHTAGELTENKTSKNLDKRRVYIDLEDEMVYSTNTQYAGNTVGLKKLALRLAIQKALREGWLAEHMFVLGAHGPEGRVTYFTGAFPSACGKTSTSMLPGQTIIGDDIAYLRIIDGKARTVNVEKGIFGIIQNVSPEDDPIIYEALTTPGEVIFGNVLVGEDNMPYWLGMGKELPEKGYNHSGQWHKGKTDDQGNEITPSHKNARYTLNISELKNKDPRLDDPEGVEVGGVVYGGRDSDTWVPVEQAYDWTEGIILKGASIESETTAATLGQEGVRKFNIMSNQDFLSMPYGQYINANLDFGKRVDKEPAVFSVNYFLRGKDGKFLNAVSDKIVWFMWAELRVHGDTDGIDTPTGVIPKYEDLVELFKKYRNKDYSKDEYVEQFKIRVPENMAKLDRIEKIYKEEISDTPQIVLDTFAKARKRLQAMADKYGDYISPFDLASN